MRKKLEILTLMLLFLGQHLFAWEAPDPQAYDELSSLPYVSISSDGSTNDTPISDSIFNSCSASIRFRVSQSTINLNDPFLKEFVDKVLPLSKKTDLVLHKIIIRGAASPEGSYAFNKTLGQKRTQALVNFLQKQDPVLNTKIEAESSNEDYSYLLYLMKQADDPDFDKVQTMFDHLHGDERLMKKSLMKQTLLWRRLYRQYFPSLRSTRVMFVFGPRLKQETVAADTLVSESPVVEPIVTETPVVEPIVTETPVEEPTVTETPVEEPTVTETPVEEPTVTETPVEESPVDETVVKPEEPVEQQLPPTSSEVTVPVDTACQEPEIPMEQFRREWMSVKTNLLYDFAYVPGYDRFCPIPNVAVEFYPLHGHFTFGGSFDCPWWQHYWQHKYFQIRNYQVNSRYYFRSGDVDVRGIGHGAAFKGAYVSAYAHAGLYSLCFGEKRGWEGEGFGGGLGVGYVLGLGKQEHWRLEFGAQFGYFYTRYDPYQYECPVDPEEQDHLYYYKWTGSADLFKKRQYRWTWMGPTRVEITLSYDLLYRKNHSRGISFRKTEKGGSR